MEIISPHTPAHHALWNILRGDRIDSVGGGDTEGIDGRATSRRREAEGRGEQEEKEEGEGRTGKERECNRGRGGGRESWWAQGGGERERGLLVPIRCLR